MPDLQNGRVDSYRVARSASLTKKILQLNKFFIGVMRSILGQSRLPKINEQEFDSVFTIPGIATVIALMLLRDVLFGKKVWRLPDKTFVKVEGDFSVLNLRRLMHEPRELKSARRVFVPPMSILKNIYFYYSRKTVICFFVPFELIASPLYDRLIF